MNKKNESYIFNNMRFVHLHRRFSFIALSITIAAKTATVPTAAGIRMFQPAEEEKPIDEAQRNHSNSMKKYDCHNVGCSMNRRLMGPPVCGVDGISYYNECLAYCQGIEIAVGGNKGACRDEIEMEGFEYIPVDSSEHKDEDVKRRLASYHDDHNDGTTTPPVTISIMNQFQDEGFKFVAKRKFSQNGPPPSHDEGDNDDTNQRKLRSGEGKEKKLEEEDEKLHAVRVTEEGYEYVAEMIFTEEEIQHLKQVTKEQKQQEAKEEEDDDDRNLIIGRDDRHRIIRTRKPPHKYVGELDYKYKGVYYQGGCSGTLVSPKSVLTAAHCVWELGKGYSYPRFAPGRDRGRNGSVSPYGNWLPAHVTKFKKYKNTHQDVTWAYDMAVIRLHPKKGKHVSTFVGGWAKITNTPWNAKILNKSQLRGYPSDKPNGQMWSSGKCPGTYRKMSDTPFGVAHKCDNWYSMSGSGLMDNKGRVHGVLSSGNNKWTWSVLLFNRNYLAARRWAGFQIKKAKGRKGRKGRKGG